MTDSHQTERILEHCRKLQAQLAICGGERSKQAAFAVRAEDRANYAERELAIVKRLLQSTYGMLEHYDQLTCLQRYPELKDYVT